MRLRASNPCLPMQSLVIMDPTPTTRKFMHLYQQGRVLEHCGSGALTCTCVCMSCEIHQGQVALTNVLLKLNRKSAVGPAAPSDVKTSDKNLDKEYDILKCLKALLNNKYGADDALAHQQVVVALVTSLISPRLTTRTYCISNEKLTILTIDH
ncbi:diaphanous GTPase-binding domain-containing protein [Daldinia vernicosa]|uniref:diaphanous GTPase-binding domain-containing protein n=1 Tax=Daldinia vernicosa TaxID=114800 RepID=UPI002007F6A0|nr:diaphanous GTPase-binding domain-containing protein [Daldinia vernicosa]KAI0848583.1 diaphanous GTPase-binding domain-containing protein [Daldinia vernicosa]